MYTPQHFREERPEVLFDAMRTIGAATLVSPGPEGLVASHLPIEVMAGPIGEASSPDTGSTPARLYCHFAKPNSHGASISDGDELLLIFQGPQSYISPSWYPSKQVTGKVVPTLNYAAIHAYGTVRMFDDLAGKRRHLTALSDHFESAYAKPWALSDAPDDYIESMCNGIIGCEITLTRLEGKWKMSQNKSEEDREGSINGLRASGETENRRIADIMAKKRQF